MTDEKTPQGAAPTVMDAQDFDMAFAALAGDGGAPPDETEKPAQPATPPEKPVEPPPADDEAAKAAEAAKVAEVVKAAADEKARADAEAARVAEAAKLEAAKEAEAKKAQEDAAKVVEAEKAKAAEMVATAEKEVQEKIDAVAKDFPETAEALVKLREMEKQLRQSALAEASAVFEAKLEALKKELAPVISTTQRVAKSEHEKAITDKHADAFDLLDEAEKWVATQPKILQAGYNRVLDSGSAAEVVEFFDIFKEATGRNKAPGDDAAKQAEAADEAERQRKLASQEGVRGRQTTKKDTLDPDDFDGAFEKFAASA